MFQSPPSIHVRPVVLYLATIFTGRENVSHGCAFVRGRLQELCKRSSQSGNTEYPNSFNGIKACSLVYRIVVVVDMFC